MANAIDAAVLSNRVQIEDYKSANNIIRNQLWWRNNRGKQMKAQRTSRQAQFASYLGEIAI